MKLPTTQTAVTAAAILLAVGTAIVNDYVRRAAEAGEDLKGSEEALVREFSTPERIQRASIDDYLMYRPIESVHWIELSRTSASTNAEAARNDIETRDE